MRDEFRAEAWQIINLKYKSGEKRTIEKFKLEFDSFWSCLGFSVEQRVHHVIHHFTRVFPC
jgi:hypothetical protein